MAKSNLPIAGCWYGITEWVSDGQIRAGELADNVFYRGKISVSTAGLKITESQRLTLALEITINSFPSGCSAFLSDLDITDPLMATQSSYINPSEALANATLASAIARYADGSTVDNGLVKPGTMIYYDLDSNQIEADRSYYIYLISTSTYASAVWSHREKATVSLAYTSTHPLTIEVGVGAAATVKRGEETLADGDEVTHGDELTVAFSAIEGYDLTSHTVNGEIFASGGSHTVDGPVAVNATAFLRAYRIGGKLYHARIGGKKYTAYIGGPDGKPVPYGRTKTAGGENA